MRILGIDYGTKNIGIALGVGDIVTPLCVIETRANHILEEDAIKKIIKLADEEHVDIIAIGLPLVGGKETNVSKEIRRFVGLLPRHLVLKFVDESMSSKVSVANAIGGGVSKKRRRTDHALSACEIIRRLAL